MTAIGLGAAMNDRCIIDLNTEISLFEIWMSDMKKLMLRQEMRYEDLRLFMFDKQYVEIEIEKKKMRLQMDEINTEIYKLHHGLGKTKVNEGSERDPSVQEKKKMKLIGCDNYHRHLKLLLESRPLVVEKMKELGCNNHPNVHMPLVMERMRKILDRFLSNDDHLDLKLMNDELKSNIEKLDLLKHEIYKMERWLDEMKMTKMKIKDITEPDVELKDHVLQFNDEESSDNELETYNYNQEKIDSFEMKLVSIQRQINRQVGEGKKQMKVNGLDYAKIAGLRAISQYWRLPLREPKELLRGVYWKKLELPKKGGLCGWDEIGKWPLAVQIYSLKLTCCSDNQDYAVEASGDIHLLIDDGEPNPCIIHVKPQILTRKDPYLLLADPTYIPLLFPSCPPMIHVKLLLRRRDEPGKRTRSKEVVDEVSMGTSALSEDVNLGTGKHYMLKLTHGIVVNTIVANISVHLHRSLWDSWDGKCMITVSDKHTPCKHVVLANYKKVPVTIDYDNRCLRLLRSRICVDFFGVLEFYIKCFGTDACLRFIPRDCYSHDNRQHKEALEGLRVQVKWSTS